VLFANVHLAAQGKASSKGGGKRAASPVQEEQPKKKQKGAKKGKIRHRDITKILVPVRVVRPGQQEVHGNTWAWG
jgi:hypothetical protein